MVRWQGKVRGMGENRAAAPPHHVEFSVWYELTAMRICWFALLTTIIISHKYKICGKKKLYTIN